MIGDSVNCANGALGTVSASDTVVSPWSWELTTGENPAYPRQDQSCYQIGGTHGALTIPALELWSHADKRGSDAYNVALGLRRAKAVYAAIAAKLDPEVRAKLRVEISDDPTAPVGLQSR